VRAKVPIDVMLAIGGVGPSGGTQSAIEALTAKSEDEIPQTSTSRQNFV
jgi:hypothetical protein